MLAFDHAPNLVEYLDCMFIVGDKQGSQECFEAINSLRPRTGLECRMASGLPYEIVNAAIRDHQAETERNGRMIPHSLEFRCVECGRKYCGQSSKVSKTVNSSDAR